MSGNLASQLNLAREPFVNRRSVWRLVGVLWGLAVILILINSFLFWRNSSGFADGRAELRRLGEQRAAEIAAIEAQRAELRAFDLDSQNQHVQFLNEKIIERTFPWSRLFDDLVATMPIEVKLSSLGHRAGDDSTRRESRRRRREAEPEGRWMELDISGQGRTGEAVLVFLENLFAHPAFAEPDLLNEVRESAGLVQFNLRTRYRTDPVRPDLSTPDPEDRPLSTSSPASGDDPAAIASERTATAARADGDPVAVEGGAP